MSANLILRVNKSNVMATFSSFMSGTYKFQVLLCVHTNHGIWFVLSEHVQEENSVLWCRALCHYKGFLTDVGLAVKQNKHISNTLWYMYICTIRKSWIMVSVNLYLTGVNQNFIIFYRCFGKRMYMYVEQHCQLLNTHVASKFLRFWFLNVM